MLGVCLFYRCGGDLLKLDEVVAAVTKQLNDQSKLGVKVEEHKQVPDVGPVADGLWWRIPEATAVFADLKSSTSLSVQGSRIEAAYAYTFFVRAMALILESFGARYVDIQGDGVFGLFSGKNSRFAAAACAVTINTQMERAVEPKFRKDGHTKHALKAGIGMDYGTLLVRRLGLRGTRQNEVWAGKPVNMAAKLSSVAGNNQVVVSDRLFEAFRNASPVRQRALLWSCGCSDGKPKVGMALAAGATKSLWNKLAVPKNLGLDFQYAYRLKTPWCGKHGSEFCEAVFTGKKPAG